MNPLSRHQSLPGDAHSLYSSQEPSQCLCPEYSQVLRYASRTVGCLEAELADTVHAVEVALIKKLVWRRKTRESAQRQRRRDAPGNGSRPNGLRNEIAGEEMMPMSVI